MNSLVLISIQTKYANEIFNGNKKYEYRRRSIGENNLNKKIYVYSAGIDKAIIGYIVIDDILCGDINYIVDKTSPKEVNIREYFKGLKKGYALHIKTYYKFDNPITLTDLRKIDKNITLPQYYKYIKESDKLYKILGGTRWTN